MWWKGHWLLSSDMKYATLQEHYWLSVSMSYCKKLQIPEAAPMGIDTIVYLAILPFDNYDIIACAAFDILRDLPVRRLIN